MRFPIPLPALLFASAALQIAAHDARAQARDAGMDAGRRDAGRRDASAPADVVARDAMPTAGLCPNVLVVLDNSCSMSNIAGDSGLSKWQSAVNALGALLPATATHTRYGLSLFPCPTCTAGCTVPSLTQSIAVEPASGTSDAVHSALMTATRTCSTPTAQYLAADLADPAINDPTRVSFVLLITDGAPTCADTAGNAAVAATTLAIQALRTNGVKMFVVGFDANVNANALDSFAVAGGEPLPASSPHRYYDATDETSLRVALDAIATTVSQELGSTLCDESCYAQGCPDGQVCTAGACVTDPCAGVTCAADQACVGGACHGACAMGCEQGQLCQDGTCVADPCAGMTCEGCVEGLCPTAGCLETDGGVHACGVGRVCRGDACVDDPCLNVQCPTATVCDRGGCVGARAHGSDAGLDAALGDGASGDGATGSASNAGCGCHATGAARHDGMASLAALAIVAAVARRRRRAG